MQDEKRGKIKQQYGKSSGRINKHVEANQIQTAKVSL
jgi:hypothetical protein